MTAASAIIQLAHSWVGDFEADLRLIPPLSDEFGVYGDAGVQYRVRKWALYHRYLLARSVPRCAHSLYLLHDCPSTGDGNSGCGPRGGFDHTSVWVPYERSYEPFIITHPYNSDAPGKLRAYASAHGLGFRCDDKLDGWYSQHTSAVRLTAGCTERISWPLGMRAQIMVAASPMDWPEMGLGTYGSWQAGAEE